MKASVPKLFGCPGAPLSSSPFPGPQLSGVVRCPHRLLNLQHRRIAPASALGSPSVPLCSSPDLLRAITFRSRMISSPCFQVLLPLNLLHQQDRSRLCPQSFRCSQALAPEQSNNLAHSSLSHSRKQPIETPSSPIHSFAPGRCLGLLGKGTQGSPMDRSGLPKGSARPIPRAGTSGPRALGRASTIRIRGSRGPQSSSAIVTSLCMEWLARVAEAPWPPALQSGRPETWFPWQAGRRAPSTAVRSVRKGWQVARGKRIDNKKAAAHAAAVGKDHGPWVKPRDCHADQNRPKVRDLSIGRAAPIPR